MKKYKYVCLFLLVTCLIIGLGSVTATDTNMTDTQKTVTDTNTQNTIKSIQNTAKTQENDNNQASKEIVKTNIKIKENKTQETKEKIKQIQTNKNNKKTIKQATTTVNVNNYEELKNNINNATTESITINLNNGTYTNTETITLNTQTCKNITINGNNQTIQGNQKQFLNTDNSNYTVRINNLIITNCSATDGGAIFNGGNLTIINSTLNNNTATSNGGAIRNNGNLRISNSIMTNNTATNDGGAINNNGNATIQNTTMNHNTANNGGAINNRGTLTIQNTTLNNNTANNGGAINNVVNKIIPLIMIFNLILSNNIANEGYVIEIEHIHNNNTIINSQFYNNTDFTKDMLFDENHGNNINNTYISNYLETTSDTPDNATLNLSDYNIHIPITTSEKYNTTINNGNFTVIINGKEYKKFVVENGSSNITIPLNVFNQTVNEVIYNYISPDKSYQPLTLNNTVTLIKHDTNITIDQIPDTLWDNKVNVIGTLKDTNGTNISNATVTVNNINVTTDANGEFTAQVNVNSGVNNITITFDGNTYYNKAEKIMTFKGLPHNTKITINPINDTSWDNKVDITGTLKDVNNTSISNATINIKVNDKTYNTTTNNKGEYNLIILVVPGLNNITVNYNGNSTYNKSHTSTTFNGVKHKTNTSIDPVKGLLGKNVTFTAHVTDRNGTRINGGYVIFKVNSITIKDKNGNQIRVNVTNGTATLTTIATWGKATNTTASYSGNEKYKASKADGTINIAKQNATVKLTIQNNGLKPGETLIAIVNVTDMDNKPVKTGNVLFKMNGKTMNYADGSQVRINVTNGIITLHYIIPVNYSAKNYTLTAIFTGNIYNRAETTTNFTLNKRDSKINMTINSKDLKPGSTLIATASVMDIEGFPVTTGKITFKLNGKILRYTNGSSIKIAVENGTAKLNYAIPKDYSAKTYTLTAEFDAGNYNTVETSKNITLSKINTYIQPINIKINGNKLTVKANIMNNDTKKIANEKTQKVSVKLDKHTVIKEVTVKNGIINLSTNVNVKPGVYIIEIVTSGNGIYNSCRQNFTINNQALLTDNSNSDLIKVIG